MNYSLSSSRKIGDYDQVIITTLNNTSEATSTALLNSLKSWHTAMAGLDVSGRETGTIEYKGFIESESAASVNLGTKADVLFTVLSTSATNPKTTSLKITNATLSDMTGSMNTAFHTITGSYINSATYYLISAIIDLY